MAHFNKIISTFCTSLIISGCANVIPELAPRVAQPKTPVARNFTSFSSSLRCVDYMLAQKGRKGILISSTGIPDLTNKIYVGGDDMLINAINQMNQTSQTYVFVDQGLEKEAGQLATLTRETNSKRLSLDAKLYFRGSISQLDSAIVNDSIATDFDLENAPNPITINKGPLGTFKKSNGKTLSVVTVDLHLVSYPSRRIIPGASVANSMVVTGRSYGAGASGLINLTGFNVSIGINRVESQGQAVRNLIELGALELLGRHAGIPYWECLNIRSTNQKYTNKRESEFHAVPTVIHVKNAQKYLGILEYYSGPTNGQINMITRRAIAKFQADQDLIATGDINFDLMERLKERAKGFPVLINVPVAARHPTATQRKSKPKLELAPTNISLTDVSKSHDVGAIFRAQLKTSRTGAVVCFHQQNSGHITQIFPTIVGQRNRIDPDSDQQVPNPESPFDIQFEKSGDRENIICIFDPTLRPAKVSANLSNSDLGPAMVKNFNDLIKHFKRQSVDISWSQLSIDVQ